VSKINSSFQAILDFVAIRSTLAWVQVVSSSLALVLTTLNINLPEKQHVAAVLNHTALGFVLVSMVADVIKMSFGLDPGPLHNRTADGKP
jgi:hypothetical protein